MRRGEIEAGAIDTELWDAARIPGVPGGDQGPPGHLQDCPLPGRRASPARSAGRTLPPPSTDQYSLQIVIGRLAESTGSCCSPSLSSHWPRSPSTARRVRSGKHADSGASSAMPDQDRALQPQGVRLEVFGTPARRPPSPTSTSTRHPARRRPAAVVVPGLDDHPAVPTNIQAQTDGSAVSCRITIDGEVKVEQSSQGADAYVFCLDKSG